MSRIVFRGANLLDGEGPARPDTTVIVENDRITRITEQAVEAHESERVVELAGRTLMPGLISSHFHATYDRITIMPHLAQIPWHMSQSRMLVQDPPVITGHGSQVTKRVPN